MQLAQHLMWIATRRELTKDEHDVEIKELWLRERKNKSSQKSFTLTCEDEVELMKAVIGLGAVCLPAWKNLK